MYIFIKCLFARDPPSYTHVNDSPIMSSSPNLSIIKVHAGVTSFGQINHCCNSLPEVKIASRKAERETRRRAGGREVSFNTVIYHLHRCFPAFLSNVKDRGGKDHIVTAEYRMYLYYCYFI